MIRRNSRSSRLNRPDLCSRLEAQNDHLCEQVANSLTPSSEGGSGQKPHCVLRTVGRSNVERLMALRTSDVAACCSSAKGWAVSQYFYCQPGNRSRAARPRTGRGGDALPPWRCGEQKTQKFVFRSALRPNQISFSHDQDPQPTLLCSLACPTRSAASYQTRSDERHRPPPPHAVFLGSCRGDMPRSSEMRSFYVAAIMPIGGPHSLNFIPILSHTARAPRARMFMGGHHARNVQVCTCSSGRHHAWW